MEKPKFLEIFAVINLINFLYIELYIEELILYSDKDLYIDDNNNNSHGETLMEDLLSMEEHVWISNYIELSMERNSNKSTVGELLYIEETNDEAPDNTYTNYIYIDTIDEYSNETI